MKRLILILLCLSMLLGVLASCNNTTPNEGGGENPDPAPTPNNTETDRLTDYRIVFPTYASSTLQGSVKELRSAILEILPKAEVEIVSDTSTKYKATNTDKEILVGKTNRPASETFYQGTPGQNFSIQTAENKIVLAGWSDYLTAKAVLLFVETYVKTSENGSLAEVKECTEKADDTAGFIVNGVSNYTVTYQRSDKALQTLADTMMEKFKTSYGVEMKSSYASATYSENSYEILFGTMDYAELKEISEAIPLGGYSITAFGKKIVIAASGEEAYKDAVEDFMTFVSDNMYVGTKNVYLPKQFDKSALSVKELADLPGSAVTPDVIRPAGSGAYTVVWEDSSYNFYEQYTQKLVESGFSLYTANNFHGNTADTKNYFATYQKDGVAVNTSFHSNNDRMYVTRTPLTNRVVLPAKEAPTYTKKCETIFTQLGTEDCKDANGNVSTESFMCYIMRVEDGSFIIWDSSMQMESIADRIYETLVKQAPDPNNIVIAAWIFTHAHGDHIGGFLEFAKKYSGYKNLKVEQFVYNFPDSSTAATLNSAQNDTVNAMGRFGADVDIITAHTGDVLYYADVKINIMYTQEDYLAVESEFYNGNTASLVTQVVTKDDVKIMIGADQSVSGTLSETDYGTQLSYLYQQCEGAIYKWYGSFSESYVCTTFHHGLGGGADEQTYAKIKPKIVLWCSAQAKIDMHDLDTNARNAYFTTDGAKNGCVYYVAANKVQIMTFGGGKATVKEYLSFQYYLDFAQE